MSDRDHWPDNPNDEPRWQPESHERGVRSGCFKTALIVGGIGFVGLLVCCGGLAWVFKGFMPKLANTPAEISALGQEIMQIDIPEQYVGQTGMSMDSWMLAMKFAVYEHKDHKGQLVLGSMQVKIGDPKDQQAAFQNQTKQQGVDDGDLKITTTEEREFTVRGKPVPFKFSEAEQAETGKKFRIVSSEFVTTEGLLIFQLRLEEDAYDEESVVKMIESIQ